MIDKTLLDVFQSFILPALGAVGGVTALVIFLFSKPQRTAEIKKTEAEARKADAEANHTINITEATLHKLTNDAAAKAIEGQKFLIDDLQERLRDVIQELASLRCEKANQDEIINKLEGKLDRLESEIGLREANIVALEEKLSRYEAENQEYRRENEVLKKQVESQRKRIKELENQIREIKAYYQERDNG